MNVITQRKLDHFDQVYGDDEYYWRDKSRKMPHNLYTSVESIRQGAVDKKMRSEWRDPLLVFAEDDSVPADRLTFSEVKINYYNGYYVKYRFDATSGRMMRDMLGEPHIDRESGDTLAADNVLICYTDHRVLDKIGRQQVDVTGPDRGWLAQKGTYTEVTWENKDGAIRAFGTDGTELPLLPGQTWVQVVPQSSVIEWR